MGGVVASIIGWVLYALNVQSVPLWAFQFVAAVMILFAIVRAYHDLRLERDRLASQIESASQRVLRHVHIRSELGDLQSRCEYYVSACRESDEIKSGEIGFVETKAWNFFKNDLKDSVYLQQMFARLHRLPKLPANESLLVGENRKLAEQRLLILRAVVVDCLMHFGPVPSVPDTEGPSQSRCRELVGNQFQRQVENRENRNLPSRNSFR